MHSINKTIGSFIRNIFRIGEVDQDEMVQSFFFSFFLMHMNTKNKGVLIFNILKNSKIDFRHFSIRQNRLRSNFSEKAV